MAGAKCADIVQGIAPNVRTIQVEDVQAGSARLDLNARFQVRWDELIPMFDAHERYGHLLGFLVSYALTVDTNATNMTAAASGRLALAAMNNIQMSAGGRNLFRGTFDARRLDDDMIAQMGGHPIALPADIPDATATDVARTVNVLYLFGSAHTARWRRDVREGGIPLSALQSRMKANDILQWQWSDDWLPTGVTGLVITSCTVLGLVGYWEQPTFEPLPFLDEVEEPDGQVTIEREYRDEPGVFDYLIGRYIESDTDGLDASSLDQIMVRCGGDTLCTGESQADRVQSIQALAAVSGNPAVFGRPAAATGVITTGLNGDFVPFMFAPGDSKRSDMGDGPVLIDVNDLGDQTILRVLCKSFTAPPESWKQACLERFGIDTRKKQVRDNVELQTAKASPGRTTTDVAPELIEQRLEVKGG